MEEKYFMFHNTLMDHTDPNTGIHMTISTDTFTKNEDSDKQNYENTLLTLAIKESSQINNRISLCTNHIYDLIRQINSFFKEGPEKAFKTTGNIRIVKYLKKSRTELLFAMSFDYDNNKPIIVMSIFNSISNNRLTVSLDYYTFISFVELMKQYMNNFIMIDSNIKSIITMQKFMSAMTNKLTSMNDNLLTSLDRLSKRIDCLSYNDKTVSEDDDIEDEYDDKEDEESSEIDNTAQVEFDKACRESNMFDNIRLPEMSTDDIEKVKPKKIESSRPFVEGFLNCNINRLREWVASFISTTETSNEALFAPIDTIVSNCGIRTRDLLEYVENKESYYTTQYAIINAIKEGIRTAIQDPKSDKYLAKNVPMIKFNKKICKGDLLYEISKEILVVYLLYNIMVKRYFSWIETNSSDMNIVDECNRTLYVIKILFTPFLLSINIDDKLEEEIEMEYNRCLDCGLLNSMEDEYCRITLGGKIHINFEIFKNTYTNFAKRIVTTTGYSFETIDKVYSILEKYNIKKPMNEIYSANDIKSNMFYKEKKKPGPKPKIVEEKVEEIIIEEVDKVLEIFMNIIPSYVDEELLEDIKCNCKRFKDLSDFMMKKDIPDELFKIKRVLEIDNTLTDKRTILKQAKLLKEDIDVSKTRASNNDISEVVDDENTNLQDIIMNYDADYKIF